MDSYQEQAEESGLKVSRNVAGPKGAATSAQPGLSAQQEKAIELIAEGKTVTACAQAVSVSRRTLQRWFKDAHFVAAYNVWRREVQGEARGRLLSLLNPAVDTISKRLEQGDLKAATLILKSLGLLEPILPGPQNVEEISAEAQSAELKRQQAREREIFDSIGLGTFPEM